MFTIGKIWWKCPDKLENICSLFILIMVVNNLPHLRARLFKLQKGCTRLAATCDKVYQLLAHCRWFSPGTPASSTTKTGHHDIAEILLKVALNTKNQIKIKSPIYGFWLPLWYIQTFLAWNAKSTFIIIWQFEYWIFYFRCTRYKLCQTVCHYYVKGRWYLSPVSP